MSSNSSGTEDVTKSVLPLTPEELADRKVPVGPRVSPDGQLVVFTVKASSQKGEHSEEVLWLSRDGAPAKPFTAGVGADSDPRWSPDGKTLLFISDRAERGTGKLYLLPIDGGEAQPLGELKGDLGDPAWSPDGKSIAVLRVDPETDAQKKRKEDKDDAIVVDADPQLTRLWVVDVETGSARQLTYGTRQVRAFAWSPDSEQLAVLTTDEPDIDALMRESQVWLTARTGGLVKPVATLRVGATSPVFVETSAGLGLVVMANGHKDDPGDSVWYVSLDGEKPRNLLPGFAGNVEYLDGHPADASKVLVRAVSGTHGQAYALDVASGTLEPLTPATMVKTGAITSGPALSADGQTLAVGWSQGQYPHEIYVGPVGGDVKPVTELGKSFLGRLQPTEVVTWTCDGVEIEGILTYPAGYEEGKRYPLIVEIHGGPSWQWEDYAFLDWHDWAQLLASHGIAVLAPNPRGSTGRGPEFQKMLINDVGGGESRDIISGALAMVEKGVADRERLGIGGWSWGGYLTAFTITQTDIFKAAMMGAGLSNLVSDHGQDDIPSANLLYFADLPYHELDQYWTRSAIPHIAKCTTPTLILHGDSDARVHPAQGMEMYRALKSLNVPVEFVRYPRQGHSIKERHHQIDLMKRLVAWYGKWLKA